MTEHNPFHLEDGPIDEALPPYTPHTADTPADQYDYSRDGEVEARFQAALTKLTIDKLGRLHVVLEVIPSYRQEITSLFDNPNIIRMFKVEPLPRHDIDEALLALLDGEL